MDTTIPWFPGRRRLRPAAGIVLLILTTGISSRATGQDTAAPDNIEGLRRILGSQGPDPAARDASLKECVGALRGLSDVRRALLLTEWRLPGVVGADEQVDVLNRRLLAERVLHEVRSVLQRGDTVTAGVVVDMVGETAAELRRQGDGTGMVRPLAPDLVALTRRSDIRLRATAARVLGQIEADVTITVPPLEELLQNREPALRRAAVDALAQLLDAADSALSHPEGPGHGTAERANLIRTVVAVLHPISRALDEPSPEVMRAAAATVSKAAETVGRLLSDPPTAEQFQTPEGKIRWQSVLAERIEVKPVLAAFREPGAALVRSLARKDRETRLSAQNALEAVAGIRGRWLRQAAGGIPADDVLLETFQSAVTTLARATADSDSQLRRSAIEALESIGTAAAPAAPALAAALGDSDRFVRWSAVRALRNIGAAAANCATPGLARLLEDPDIDIRLAAAAALQQFAPTGSASGIQTVGYAPGRLSTFARTALPPLLRSMRSDDPEVRTAAMRTLRGLGPEARLAVPALCVALSDPNPHIRKVAAETLGAVGSAATEAVGNLRRAAQDADAEVRQAADEAVLNILLLTAPAATSVMLDRKRPRWAAPHIALPQETDQHDAEPAQE